MVHNQPDDHERAHHGIAGSISWRTVPIPPGTAVRSLAAHAVMAYSERLLARFDGKSRWKRANVLLRLYENLRRLDWRYAEYDAISRVITANDLMMHNALP